MCDSPPDDEHSDITEEISFWRDFIQWWSREKDRPVPSRAWEALAYAEAKHNAKDSMFVNAKNS